MISDVGYWGNGGKNLFTRVVAISGLLITKWSSRDLNPEIVAKLDVLALFDKYFDACQISSLSEIFYVGDEMHQVIMEG